MPTEQVAPSAAPENPSHRPALRLPWVDNLRTLLILLVVNIHACVTYSHVGDWYIKEQPEPPLLPAKLVFLIWEGHLQAFFMGLLFFLAGFFAHGSIARHGVGKFVRERLLRLGVPLLAFVFIINPFVLFVMHPWPGHPPPLGVAYSRFLASGRFLEETGPLWFVETLLVFSGLLALVRTLWPAAGKAPAPPQHWPTIRPARFLLLGLALTLASFLVRTVQPIGVSVLNLQFCFFAQYVAAFSLGAIAARHFDLGSIARLPFAKLWSWTAVVLGPLAVTGLFLAAMPVLVPDVELPPFYGGWNWLALGFAAWEQFAGIALALGIMAFAFRRLNFEAAWTRWLNERSFGVYVIHTPVLIGVTLGLRGIHANPFVMAGLLTVLGLAGSFIAADLLRRIPLVRAAV
ncbi:MAG TPA: acyltransferase family protein [Opitutaceae bacterium]|nr:acyltransferase family protein [Opitutaceae bacterium]